MIKRNLGGLNLAGLHEMDKVVNPYDYLGQGIQEWTK